MKRNIIWENLTYAVLWTFMFIAPLLSLYVRTTLDDAVDFQWTDIFRVWHIYIGYFVVFIVHNFIFAPQLVYRHRKTFYFIGIFCLLASFMLYRCVGKNDDPVDDKMRMEMMQRGEGKPVEQEGMTPDGRPKPDGTHRPPDLNKPEPREMTGRHPDDVPPVEFGLHHLFQLIVAVLILGMNLGIKFYFKTQEDQEEMKELEKRSLEQQLRYLKFQINPHFYMNTLNNIHALVDIDPARAKETILILSKIMRYVLYEGDRHLIGVGREVDFVRNYIRLMKLRYTDRVKITTRFPEQIPQAGIPPLILVTFVENAFKHGVSYKQESFIDIAIEINGGRLKFVCNNSKVSKDDAGHETGGVGLANVKQRLDIIFGKEYTLDIQDNSDTYEVLLLLPLDRNISTDTNNSINQTL